MSVCQLENVLNASTSVGVVPMPVLNVSDLVLKLLGAAALTEAKRRVAVHAAPVGDQ